MLPEIQIPVTDMPSPNPALDAFLSFCKILSIPAKRPIIRPGDPADRLYYLIDGSATISMEDDQGNDIILGYTNSGDFIGETGVFMALTPRQVTVRSRTTCSVAEVTYERLRALAEHELKDHYAAILTMLAAQLSRRLMQTTRKVGHLAFMDAAGRIANTLFDLCKQPDAMTHPEGMQIKISRTELGRIVGCSREMVGRVLKNMENDGSISAKGKTIVVRGTR